MNSVKKFTTFDELKSCESKTENYTATLKKHNDLKKFIMEIKSTKTPKTNQTNSKPKR